MADGLFYHDSRAPFINADAAAVTLATTDKALYPAAAGRMLVMKVVAVTVNQNDAPTFAANKLALSDD